MARITALLLAGVLLLPATATAKTKKDLTYSFKAVWTTAIRMLRADRGYKITDKDRDSGYILFVFPGSGSVKECRASLEIVDTVDENRFKVVRLQLEIAHQPSYIELDLLDRLESKLREERGGPPPPKVQDKERPGPQPKDKDKDKDNQPRQEQTAVSLWPSLAPARPAT